jgi:hypothetical protein
VSPLGRLSSTRLTHKDHSIVSLKSTAQSHNERERDGGFQARRPRQSLSDGDQETTAGLPAVRPSYLADAPQTTPTVILAIAVGVLFPQMGTVVEVRYLYAFPESGSIYQPVYLGPRDDIPAEDCTVDQLKFKQAQAPIRVGARPVRPNPRLAAQRNPPSAMAAPSSSKIPDAARRGSKTTAAKLILGMAGRRIMLSSLEIRP